MNQKKSKIEGFIKRNKRINSHLYDDNLVEGYDYVVCPVTNCRISMLKRTYIENILGISIFDFDEKFPNIQKICKKRVDNIKSGLKEIDPISGMTKYDLSQVKAREILSSVDENGISGYKKKGQKTRQTHLENVDEYGRNGYSQIATKAIIKGNDTKYKKGLILDPSLKGEFYRYKAVVIYLTEKHRKSLAKGYKTGLCGTEGAYQIDHNYSIMEGYKNKISPFVIGNIKNLRMIPWEENISKHTSSDIKICELFSLTNYTEEKSLFEYNSVMEIIKNQIDEKIPVSGAKVISILYESDIFRK